MSVINDDNKAGWQQIANDVSRQRPYVGRTATVIHGRKLQGEHVTVLKHQHDQYDRNAFRYGGDASLQLREMMGRSGFVCLVRSDAGVERWIKARYLACDFQYTHWTIALSDALLIGGSS